MNTDNLPRYYPKDVPIPLWKSVWNWLLGRGWDRFDHVLVEVFTSPGYKIHLTNPNWRPLQDGDMAITTNPEMLTKDKFFAELAELIAKHEGIVIYYEGIGSHNESTPDTFLLKFPMTDITQTQFWYKLKKAWDERTK